MNYLSTALEYHKSGFRIIPVNEDKRPVVAWKQFQASQTEEDIRAIFTNDCYGIAVLTGVNGLECIDIDCKYSLTPGMEVDYMKLLDDTKTISFLDLTVIRTKSGGFHALYRAQNIGGNTKLARRHSSPDELKNDPNDKIKVLFETRGVGGYIVAHPTPGYELQVGNMFSIPTITNTQRNTLITVAKTFNEVFDASEKDAPPPPPQNFNGLTSWDAYNQSADILSLLERHGWKIIRTIGDRVYLRRPGKDSGCWSGDWNTKLRLFKAFTTSTQFDSEKAYTPYGVFKVLECGGDSSLAAKQLYQMGYGDRITQNEVVLTQEQQDDLWEKIKSTKFGFGNKPEDIDFVLKVRIDGEEYNIGGFGMLGLVTGLEKSRKTTFLKAMVASGLSKERKINFSLDLKEKAMVYIDTEQPEHFFYSTQSQAHEMAGFHTDADGYHAFRLRGFSVEERVAAIDLIISKIPNIGVLIIDGALDLVKNFNNEEQCQALGQKFLEWTDKSKALILTVIHTSKSTGFTTGHLGAILNKKCDFCFEMINDEEARKTTVKNKFGRTKPFPGFDFTQDDRGWPVLLREEFLPTPPDWSSDIKKSEDTSFVPF